MAKNLRRHIAAVKPVIEELSANLVSIPTQPARDYLALLYAVRIGAATKDIIDLSPAEMMRLCHEIAERIASAVQAAPKVDPVK